MTKRAYYKNGLLYDVSPRDPLLSLYEDRQTAYDATIVISDGKTYDITTIDGVNALPIPQFKSFSGILELSYILKLHCGIVEDPLIISAMVDKVLSLMKASRLMWSPGDYLQVIRNYYRLGLFEDGDLYESKYRNKNYELFSQLQDNTYEGEHIRTKIYFENKLRRYGEYNQLKIMYPDLVPKTVRGYLQIRTRRTKRFLEIKEKAESNGMTFNFSTNLHFCRKIQKFVEFQFEYETIRDTKKLKSCLCSECSSFCGGVNDYGLICCYNAKKA